MAESAESQRRRRRHRAGDHSLCDAARCAALSGARVPSGTDPTGQAPIVAQAASGAAGDAVAAPPGPREPGGIEVAVQAYVESLPYRAGDPRALLAQIAVRLAQRVDETGALPAAVRELRVLLVQLAEIPNGPAGFVDEVRLRRAQRRLDVLIAQAG